MRTVSAVEAEIEIDFAPAGMGGGLTVWAQARDALGAAQALIMRLWRGLNSPAPERPTRLEVERDPSGRPLLLVDGRLGPGLSFSRAQGRLWAALGLNGPVGLDAASPQEFGPGYPARRVAGPGELAMALTLCGRMDEALALLWSLKEAAAKAQGVGLAGLDPRQAVVELERPLGRGLAFQVRAGRTWPAWAVRRGGCWLALAKGDSV